MVIITSENEGGYIYLVHFKKEIYRQAVTHPQVLCDNRGIRSVQGNASLFNSRLEKKKLRENGFTPLPTWQDALGRYLQELKRQGEL